MNIHLCKSGSHHMVRVESEDTETSYFVCECPAALQHRFDFNAIATAVRHKWDETPESDERTKLYVRVFAPTSFDTPSEAGRRHFIENDRLAFASVHMADAVATAAAVPDVVGYKGPCAYCGTLYTPAETKPVSLESVEYF